MKIRPKKHIADAILIIAAAYIAVTAIVRPARTAKSVISAMELSARAVVPSLFAFVAAIGILSPALAVLFSKMKGAKRLFGVGAGGLTMMAAGLLSGFPTAAVTYSEMSRLGAIDESEGESLMPFCSGASAAFLIGAVGTGMFHDTSLGVRLFLCQTVSSLVLIFATRKRRAPSPPVMSKTEKTTPATAARAVADAGATMLGITAFIVFFTVVSDALSEGLRLPGILDGVLRGALEISGGLAALSRLGDAGRCLAGYAVGFSGISVFMQCHHASRGAAMKKYLGGKLIMSAATGTLFLMTEFFRATPVFFELFGSRATEAKNTVEFACVFSLIVAFCTIFCVFVWHKAPKARK
ncbi:MAG: hypothetical protein IKP68_05805 [Clostridia bacterium]|nr:hypothetical protein [Clostridia bacterium]